MKRERDNQKKKIIKSFYFQLRLGADGSVLAASHGYRRLNKFKLERQTDREIEKKR
jgi:hypothetical protein